MAAANEARWRAGGKPQVLRRITAIDPRWWQNALDVQGWSAPLWTRSEFSCRIPLGAASEYYYDAGDDADDDYAEVNFYGVRFEWEALYDVVLGLRAQRHGMRQLEKALAEVDPTSRLPKLGDARPISNAPVKPVTKTVVSAATLNAWWELYKTVREPRERSDDDMRAHFEQCCPDKSVTRDRFRKVRGRLTPGRKPDPAK